MLRHFRKTQLRPVYTKTLETLPFSCENENAPQSVFPENVLGSSPCKHSKTTIRMKTQNGGLIAFAHSSYCLTIHQLLVLFIDRNILEDQDIYPLEGIKTCGCSRKSVRISAYFVFTFSQSVHSPECLTLYSHASVSRSSTSSSLH